MTKIWARNRTPGYSSAGASVTVLIQTNFRYREGDCGLIATKQLGEPLLLVAHLALDQQGLNVTTMRRLGVVSAKNGSKVFGQVARGIFLKTINRNNSHPGKTPAPVPVVAPVPQTGKGR